MAAEEDPWALFEDEDAAGAAAATSVAKPAGVARTRGMASERDITSTPRVSVPWQRTVPPLAEFLDEHAEHTLRDITKTYLPAITAADEKAAVTAMHDCLQDIRKAVHSLTGAAAPAAAKKASYGASSKRKKEVEPDADLGVLLDAGRKVTALAWAWMEEHGSWPHVVWRELYVMGKLAAAVALSSRGHQPEAMEAVDLALILGAPAAEIGAIVFAVSTGARAMAAADAAIRAKMTGVAPVHLPPVPPVLDASAYLPTIVTGITPETSIPRVRAQAYPTAGAGKGAGGGGGGGSSKAKKKRAKRKGKKHGAASGAAAGVSAAGGATAAVGDAEEDDEDDEEGEEAAADAVTAGAAAPTAASGAEHPFLASVRAVNTTTAARAPLAAASASTPTATAGGAAAADGAAATSAPAAASKPLSLAEFRRQYVKPSKPVVLVGATGGWPALAKWRDLDALVEAHGHRTVPVEIGQHLSGYWHEQTLTLRAFVADHIVPALQWGWGKRVVLESPAAVAAASGGSTPVTAAAASAAAASAAAPVDAAAASPASSGGASDAAATTPAAASTTATATAAAGDGAVVIHPRQIAYLAQHTLFDQVPSLIEDFTIPLYAGDEVGSINAWFGTAGTVTRLHFDSYENLLTQVFGYKYVRLYSPEDTPNLYPIKSSAAAPTAAAAGAASGGKADATTSQGNISAVDVEAPDFTAHPLARSARYYETVLGPGDVLYIPANWWHFVRSLTPSFSINFWF